MTLLIAKILLTLATLGYSLGTVIADLNKTHSTNPLWTPHARFHVVWQVLSYSGFGLLALLLTWTPGPYEVERLYLVCIIAFVVFAAFFATWIAMPMYGGTNYDQNGYPPSPVRIVGRTIMLDANFTAISVQSVLLVVAFMLILAR
ncbi:MAG: hypothetical protein GEU91_06570 [Rhizobiales bacterium]|nr:hypothetical protein [Hyphomicrobiales bacterium]